MYHPIVKVHVLSTEESDKIREVRIPLDAELHLDNVFYFGQNDFAVGPELNTTCSVSKGDVVEWEGKLMIVQAAGFGEITEKQFEHYKGMSRRDRPFSDIADGTGRGLFVVTDEGVTEQRRAS